MEASLNSGDADADQNATKSNFTEAPVRRTEVPDSPCDDPDQGAPSALDKRAAKCTVTGSPQCTKIQERFLLIQTGIQDERDDLQEEITKVERQCDSTKANVQQQILDTDQSLKDQQTK